MAELRQLSEEAAEALLTQIKKEASSWSGEQLFHLANAYKAVRESMPRQTGSSRSASTS